MERSYSSKYMAGSSDYDLYQNKNTEWLSGPGTLICYVSMVLVLWAFFHFSGLFPAAEEWTVVSVFHAVGTFIFLHWIKGNPDESSQGDYNAFTVYEQIQAGVPYTSTKKMLMLIPALLCWVSCYTSNYRPTDCIVNLGLLLVCIIPKIPEMHRVRLFGLNSTAGIDDEVEYTGTGATSAAQDQNSKRNSAKGKAKGKAQ